MVEIALEEGVNDLAGRLNETSGRLSSLLMHGKGYQ